MNVSCVIYKTFRNFISTIMGLDYRALVKFETNLKVHVEMHVNILKYIIEILRILLISKEISNK